MPGGNSGSGILAVPIVKPRLDELWVVNLRATRCVLWLRQSGWAIVLLGQTIPFAFTKAVSQKYRRPVIVKVKA